MYPADFETRKKIAEQADFVGSRLNCVSAAYYLLGLQTKETYIDPKYNATSIKKMLELIESSPRPLIEIPTETSLLAVWSPKRERFLHFGVVDRDRETIIHRYNVGHPLTTIPYEEFFTPYANFKAFAFYEPVIEYYKIAALKRTGIRQVSQFFRGLIKRSA